MNYLTPFLWLTLSVLCAIQSMIKFPSSRMTVQGISSLSTPPYYQKCHPPFVLPAGENKIEVDWFTGEVSLNGKVVSTLEQQKEYHINFHYENKS